MFQLPDMSKLGEIVPKIEAFIQSMLQTMENLFSSQKSLHEKLDRIEAKINLAFVSENDPEIKQTKEIEND